MAKNRYYKLGEKAHQFFDPISHTQITGKQVISLEKDPTNKVFTAAKAGGHIVVASEEEYNTWAVIAAQDEEIKNMKLGIDTPTKDIKAPTLEKGIISIDKGLSQDDLEDVLDEMTNSELIQAITNYGFDNADIKAAKGLMKNHTKLVEFIMKQYPVYTEEK